LKSDDFEYLGSLLNKSTKDGSFTKYLRELSHPVGFGEKILKGFAGMVTLNNADINHDDEPVYFFNNILLTLKYEA
jgi:hypothetical protein